MIKRHDKGVANDVEFNLFLIDDDVRPVYPQRAVLSAIVLGLFSSMFLVALDMVSLVIFVKK